MREFEKRILSELEEAGQENFPTLLNTIVTPTGNASERNEFQTALTNLLQNGFIKIGLERDANRRLKNMSDEDSFALLTRITEHLVFKTQSGHWTGGARPWPEVVYTEMGKVEGRKILQEFGYQWWRQKD
ncbi:hypothetical protein Hden_1107 [Hyphomicrobium denitrificans ATCC 51888]|uniref:Uncharacterized protein n=2 Tax=Hyphomicrobium denitrificans TaxID=53399 RepID=D8JVN2_HYPDA|nr:hypothetical protein Hden_1107 [Hyphomicrobium denitrificans ATCC 51888]